MVSYTMVLRSVLRRMKRMFYSAANTMSHLDGLHTSVLTVSDQDESVFTGSVSYSMSPEEVQNMLNGYPCTYSVSLSGVTAECSTAAISLTEQTMK